MKHHLPAAAALAAAATLAVAVSGANGAARPAHAGAATVATQKTALGRVLVDGRGRTLYLFERDARGRSRCSGACAGYWPPLLTRGRPAARGAARPSLLGVARRADGGSQVTYAGHPLYRFVQDTARGQVRGQGLDLYGGEWYAVAASGRAVEDG